ncbi:hypothetical protein CBS14141_003900 [Malassezia furfur]|nr:hypothetical protein CBS14141_003900 [Malassezia furfur]
MACASTARMTTCAKQAPILCSFVPYRVPYAVGLGLQEHLVARRARARAELRAAQIPLHGQDELQGNLAEARRIANTDILLLLEHTPVYTLGKRNDAAVKGVSASGLQADIFHTQRGGLLTYHGPGQLVGYPILDLGAMGLSARCYIDRLQQSLRAALEAPPIAIPTQMAPSTEAKYTGIWVDDTHKIASLGVHVRHRITSHGFALNVFNTALQGFQNIVACGLPDVRLTSIEEQLQKQDRPMTLTLPQVSGRVSAQLAHTLNREIELAPPSLLTYFANEIDGVEVLDRVLVDGVEVERAQSP